MLTIIVVSLVALLILALVFLYVDKDKGYSNSYSSRLDEQKFNNPSDARMFSYGLE